MAEPLPTIKSCVIFDLDGTLADTRHRLHLIREKKHGEFGAACVHDTPYVYLVHLCNMISCNLPVFICTGRSAEYLIQTQAWLSANNVKYQTLLMRAEGNHRPDAVVKKEMLNKIRRDGYEPLFAVEDRPSVVKMWREAGVPCLVTDDTTWAEDDEE